MTGEVRKSINNRYKLLLKARKTPRGSKEWHDYRRARNACTNLIRFTKANFWKNKFLESDSPKSFWSLVRKFNGDPKKQHTGPLKSETKIITRDTDKADLLNKFFADIGKKLATPSTVDGGPRDMNSYIYRISPSVSEINLSTELLKKSFEAAVRVGKACGPDNITAKDLKLHPNCSITGLEKVVRCSLISGKFPTQWKISKVTAIHKKGSKTDCSNFRPISLLSVPSKIVEHLICSQMVEHLTEHNLQTEHQWGFRSHRSTEDALLHMTEKWRRALDSGLVVGVLFIDFRKAFDTVSHQILLKKLSACGISGNFLEYVENYLTNRKQYTVVNGMSSTLADVKFGVPQGSHIGPTSFSVNVNDMCDCIDCDMDQFADDSTAHTIGSNVDKVLADLSTSANQIETYTKRNSVTIHPEKCEILILSRKKFIGPLRNVEIGGRNIEIVKSSKCLGVILDKELKWTEHVTTACKRFSQKVKKLYQMRSMPKTTLLSIYNQGILPSVLYAIVIWGNCSPSLMLTIEKVHIRAARFVFRLKKSIPDNEVLQTVNWKQITHYYKRTLANKAFKIYNNLTSPLLAELMKKSNFRATRNAFKIDVPSFKYVDFKKSFQYRIAIIWNNIPNKIREKSYESFKNDIKKNPTVLDKISFNLCQNW